MENVDVVILGAGQAGLAASRHLTARDVSHVVLERGQVAERWRSERWDSLRTLTPRWQSRLPGSSRLDQAPELDPHGFMSMPEVAAFLTGYAKSFRAPLREGVRALAVLGRANDFEVLTDRGDFQTRSVVLATGACARPLIPRSGRRITRRVVQLPATRYRRPDALPPGAVLVVGGAASGLQIADELARAGREVWLAVGAHTRMPRRYRGRDVMAWLDDAGILDERFDATRARRAHPSLQLVAGATDLDLGVLASRGVRLFGTLAGADGEHVDFADDLATHVAESETRMHRTLDRVDAFAPPNAPARRPAPLTLSSAHCREHLGGAGIGTVIWATGFSPDHSLVRVPDALDPHGVLRHVGGVGTVDGLYALGLPMLRRRNSTFLDGCGEDAREVMSLLTRGLARAA